MAESKSGTKRWPRFLWFLGMSVLGGGCDLHSKAWAEGTLIPGKAMTVIEPWLEFSLSYNRGTAFSFIRDLGAARVAFGVLALAVVVLLAVMIIRGKADLKESIALGAIAGGAIGNGINRLVSGAVVDFIKFNYPWAGSSRAERVGGLIDGGSWPTFNVADALVVCGVAGLLLLRFFRRFRRDAADPPEAVVFR